MIHLILGGARSGKSSYALEQVKTLAKKHQKQVTFVATATSLDGEMSARIKRHKSERPTTWKLAEVPLDLTELIQESQQHTQQILLIDCLTLWLNNQLFENSTQDFQALFSKLMIALKNSHHDIFLVSNEVGLGVIPMGEISRQFVDQAGWLNQAIAANADRVTFVAAGLPMNLKGDK